MEDAEVYHSLPLQYEEARAKGHANLEDNGVVSRTEKRGFGVDDGAEWQT